MKFLIIGLLTVSAQSYGQSVVGRPEFDNVNKPLLQIIVENTTNENYFCRSITAENVDYHFSESDTYFISIDAKTKNRYIDKNTRTQYLQDLNIDISDILKSEYKFYTKLDYVKMVNDCEPKSSRLNSVFVLDDCNGDIALKTYTFDGLNLSLVPSEIQGVIFSQKAKFFKLNTANGLVVHDRNEISFFELRGSTISEKDVLTQLTHKERLIAAISLRENSLLLAKYSVDNGIELLVFEKTPKGFEENKKLHHQMGKFSLKVDEFPLNTIINREEIERAFANDLDAMVENISIYSKNNATHSMLDLFFVARKPSVDRVYSDFDPTAGEVPWKLKLRKNDISESLEYTQAYLGYSYVNEIKRVDRILPPVSELMDVISKNIFLVEGQSFNHLKFKEYYLAAGAESIVISNGEKQNIIPGFCSIKGFFSDLMITSEINIDEMFEGRLVLTKAIRSNIYKDVLKALTLGADVNFKDLQGYPIDFAMARKNVDIVTLLLERGAAIDHEYRGKSLFSVYINSVLSDYSDLTLTEKMVALDNLERMYVVFKKYNYDLKTDKDYNDVLIQINGLEDGNKILVALGLQ